MKKASYLRLFFVLKTQDDEKLRDRIADYQE